MTDAQGRGRPARWPSRPVGIAFGGDYNPEQWPEEVWLEDVRLMRAAGVNLVSVAIFAWATLEPEPGRFDTAWLSRLLDLLHDNGITVDLGTPTAGPPAWLYRDAPQAWVVDRDGRRLGPGSRGAMCPHSDAYRDACAAVTAVLAEQFGAHPAVVLWHVHNEYGAPVLECHCPTSVEAFRSWLAARYGDVEALNDAWGTTFWGQRYGGFDQVWTPAASASVINPAQRLDFARFSDASLRECFVRERDVIRARSPQQPGEAPVPVTTNFMASSCPGIDYWAWAREVDVVSNDHYLTAERRDAHVMLAMDADLTRSLAGGRPWVLMEHSTSAVNWQPRNVAKLAGEMARNSLSHVARGADGALFFQWRASRRGAEKFHSSMLPHAGTGSRVWAETVELGATLARLAGVRGSTVHADVALLWDWESFWAQDLDWRPSVDLSHRERVEAFYRSLWQDRVTVDFAHPEADLSGYRMVVAPQLYLVGAQAAKNLESFVLEGGQLLVSYFSGVVDAHDGVHPEGLSGPLGRVLGVDVEEFAPLRADERVHVDLGAGGSRLLADVWAEHVVVDPGTEVLGRFADGPASGRPALTRRAVGAGSAWYLATRPDSAGLRQVLDLVGADAGVQPRRDLPDDFDVVDRTDGSTRFRFLVNGSGLDVTVDGMGEELVTGRRTDGRVTVPAGAVRVLSSPIT
jgi:beta-galactosidase